MLLIVLFPIQLAIYICKVSILEYFWATSICALKAYHVSSSTFLHGFFICS